MEGVQLGNDSDRCAGPRSEWRREGGRKKKGVRGEGRVADNGARTPLVFSMNSDMS